MGGCASKSDGISPRHVGYSRGAVQHDAPRQYASSSPGHPAPEGLGTPAPARPKSDATTRPRATISGASSPALETAARDLFAFVRAHYYNRHDGQHLKSSNKMEPNRDGDLARCEAAYAELVRFRSAVQYDDQIVNGTRAHNCGELTGLVLHHCRQMGIPHARLTIGGDDNTHHLAIIGNLPDAPLGNDMRQWPKDLCFVDVWSGIHGRAVDFPDLFLQKMNGWAEKEKYLQHEGEWMQGNDQRWLNAVLDGEKIFRS